jgi:endonuclease-3 related protein
MVRGESAREILPRLRRAYGPQGWWPADSPFEICVGAALVQNTRWRNVELAIANLRREGLLQPGKILGVAPSRLERVIRPAGTYRRKTRTLRTLSRFLLERCGGDPRRLRQWDVDEARRKLLSVNGVGEETADAILLYAAEMPVFVVDAITRRVMSRHALTACGSGDQAIRDLFMRLLRRRPKPLQELHALMVRVGKDRCRRREWLCGGCPLEPLLPTGRHGVREPPGPSEGCRRSVTSTPQRKELSTRDVGTE